MKGLIDFFVDRYRTTLTMMFLVLTWGIFSYGQIPNASEPDIDVPFVMVSTFYEGVSPEDAERLISRPLEKRLLTVDDVKGVQSYSRLDFSTVIVEFPNDFDPDIAKTNVRDAVDEVATSSTASRTFVFAMSGSKSLGNSTITVEKSNLL